MSNNCNQDKFNTVSKFNQYIKKLAIFLPNIAHVTLIIFSSVQEIIERYYTHCTLKFGIIFCNEKGDRSRIKLESP
jgi:hypothetical protein